MPANPWLPVVERLAREVAVAEYIHDIDARRDVGGSPRSDHWTRLARVGALLVGGAVLGQAVPWACGLRLVTSAQVRLVDAVTRIDPRAERWSDQRLQERLEYRREAMNLIEHTIATPNATTYPHMSRLSGHPSPLVDPGAAPALLLLANALDRFPANQRGHYVQAVVAAGVALDDPDLQATLQILGDLAPDTRKRLMADRAAGLKHMLADELAFQDVVTERDHLRLELSVERMALDAETKALASAIEAAQRRQRDLSNADRHCAAVFSQYRACLVTASQAPPAAEHD